MSHTYRINTDKTPAFMIDNENQLPVLTPTVGRWYQSYTWLEHQDNFVQLAYAVYKGDGVWVDDNTGTDYTNDFKWCDYIEPIYM